MSSASLSYVYRPSTIGGVRDVFDIARRLGMTIAIKGAGNSYGDAFQNSENIVLDLTRFNRVLSWDPESGVIKCEPGVTIRDLWRYTIDDGWWPPVVSGTSHVTVGGALAANIHGKNNFKSGPIGEHVLRFELMLPTGETFTCSRLENADIFHAAIGGFGLLGVIVSAELQLKKLNSGLLAVRAASVKNWNETFDVFEREQSTSDYLVGWIDCFAGGASAGRGLIHAATYKDYGEDAHPEETLKVATQELSDATYGGIARSRMHRMMRYLVNRFDMRLVNAAKYHLGKREHGKIVSQPIVEFNFLLDSAPNWKWAYKPGSLIQYQCFIPRESAQPVFDEITKLSRERGLPAFLGVMKRHRPDEFLLSHAIDGYSLALDYPVTRATRDRLWRLCADMDEIALSAKGRFYFAKDSTLTPEHARRYLGEALERFLELKQRLDPEGLLQTELSKRVLGRIGAEPVKKPIRRPETEVEQESGHSSREEFAMPEPFWAKSPEAEESPRKIEESQ